MTLQAGQPVGGHFPSPITGLNDRNPQYQPISGPFSPPPTTVHRIYRREPRPGETETPLFNAIWEVVKWWEVHEGGTVWSVTGNDVCLIIDAIQAILEQK